MTVLEINSVCHGSTGNIAKSICKYLASISSRGILCVPKGRHNKDIKAADTILFGNSLSEDSHILLNRITGITGVFSVFATRRLLRKVKSLKPDLIHLHNLHNSYINIPLLFKFIKKNQIPVVWTFHDCWPITGHCCHFEDGACEKWKTGCCNCAHKKAYPRSLIDNSKLMFKLKKKWFTNVPNLTIVTPSKWLHDIINDSYMNGYQIKTINNGINLKTFSRTESNFRQQFNLFHKKIVLGVASGWSNKKGIDVFISLNDILSDEYQIVLVGTNPKLEKKLPKNIISIHKTQNQTELAEIYSSADVFVNPTREDTYPTVNIEAIACGTPVVTFRTGGSTEIVGDKFGVVVEKNNINQMKYAIERICNNKSEYIINSESIHKFSNELFLSKYIDLFRSIVNE